MGRAHHDDAFSAISENMTDSAAWRAWWMLVTAVNIVRLNEFWVNKFDCVQLGILRNQFGKKKILFGVGNGAECRPEISPSDGPDKHLFFWIYVL